MEDEVFKLQVHIIYTTFRGFKVPLVLKNKLVCNESGGTVGCEGATDWILYLKETSRQNNLRTVTVNQSSASEVNTTLVPGNSLLGTKMFLCPHLYTSVLLACVLPDIMMHVLLIQMRWYPDVNIILITVILIDTNFTRSVVLIQRTTTRHKP